MTLAENPNCRGFKPEEFQMLDFSKMDISGYFGDLNAKSADEVQKEMKEKFDDSY